MGIQIRKNIKQQKLLKQQNSAQKMVARDTPENQLELPLTVSLDPLSEDSVEEVVSRGSPRSSMMTPELSSDPSSSRSSEMPLHTPSTPEERPSPLWMSSTPSRDKVELSTVSVTDLECEDVI